jgi:hypothetical protein
MLLARYIHLQPQKPFGMVCLPFFEFRLPFLWKRSIEGDSKLQFRFPEQCKSSRRKLHVEVLFEDRLLVETREQRPRQWKLNLQSSWREGGKGGMVCLRIFIQYDLTVSCLTVIFR